MPVVWNPQANEIFLQLLERPLAEREAFLQQACGDDAALAAQVRSLLTASDQAGSFLNAPAVAAPTMDQAPLERPGSQIGPYKLLQQIGEGGMGVVYMAEQSEPVRRKVALKIIKPGMDSRQVIARFEAERQALSLMDHPNIAKVLDAGTTDSGRPYFVMELVKGQPITHYCDEKHLTPRQRLQLLLPVCQAIQHAHQKGIIHRDIKPTNIIVAEYDQQPVPKVIDFGVAKATSQPLTEKTMFTGLGQIVGTLEYMSPEQAKVNQLDIDTRSDIYSLGVLLYELLTGSTPFDKERLRSAAWDEMLRIIREEEPPKPSTKLSESKDSLPSISAQRQTEPAKLAKLVRGELDWIVMKALEKDRNRRYETANAFAADLEHYLNDEPVVACPPSVMYRFHKFVRRNKQALAAVGLLLFFIVLLGGGAGWVLRDRSARLATTERECEAALAEATRLAGQRKWPEALAWVQRAEGVLANGGGSAALRRRVQDLRKDLEMVAKLEEIRLEAADVKVDRFDRARKGPAYAPAFREYGIDVNALGAEEAARRIRASIVPVELAAALDDWARGAPPDDNESRHLTAIARLADPDPWRNRFRDAIEQRDLKVMTELAASDEIDQMSARTLYLLGDYLRWAGADELRLTMLRRAQRRHPDDFWANQQLGFCLMSQIKPTRPQEAVRFMTAAVALRPRSPGTHLNLGNALGFSGAYDEAVAAFREAIRLKPDFAEPHFGLGVALRMKGRFDEAIAAFREAIRLKPDDASAYQGLGAILCDHKRDYDGAIVAFREAIRLQPKVAGHYVNLGNAFQGKGALDEAIAAYREAIRLKPDDASAYYHLGEVLCYGKHDADGAIAAFRAAVRLQGNVAIHHHGLGDAFLVKGALDEAIAAYKESIRIDAKWAPSHGRLGVALKRKGAFADAIASYEKSIELAPKAIEPIYDLAWLLATCPDPKYRDGRRAVELAKKAVDLDKSDAACWQILGWAQYRSGDWKASIAALEKSMELQQSPRGGDSGQWFGLAMAHWQLGNKDEARKWYDQAVEWMDKNQPNDEDFRRFRAEAATLLGVEKKQD